MKTLKLKLGLFKCEGIARVFLFKFNFMSLLIKEYLVPNEEKTFENVVEPLLTEEYEINYAFQTLMLKMLTDWPEGSRKLFDADLHHVSRIRSHFLFSMHQSFQIKMTAARDYMEKLTHRVFQDSIKVGCLSE